MVDAVSCLGFQVKGWLFTEHILGDEDERGMLFGV